MKEVYNKNFKTTVYFVKKLPGVKEGVAKAYNSISTAFHIPGRLPNVVDYMGRIMSIPVTAGLFTSTSVQNAQQEVQDIIVSLGGVSQAAPYYETHMPDVLEKMSSLIIRVFNFKIPFLSQFSTALYTNVELIEAQREHNNVPEQILNAGSVVNNMYSETMPEKVGRKLAPLVAMIRRPFLVITDNVLIRAMGDILGSPTVTNTFALAGSAIVLKAAISAGLAGTIIIAGVQFAAPLAVAMAVASVISIAFTTSSKALKVQKARNKELEYRAIEEIEYNIRTINERIQDLEKNDKSYALSVSIKNNMIAGHVYDVSSDSHMEGKSLKFSVAAKKTMLGRFVHYATTVFTTVVTMSTVPIAAAFTALSTIIGIISDMGSNINRQLAIDAENIAIGQKVDNILGKLGIDVGKLHGVERTRAVLKMANRIRAEKIAMDRVIVSMQSRHDGSIVKDEKEANSLFLQYKKEEMDKLNKDGAVKTTSLLSSYIQTVIADISVRSSSTVDIPVCLAKNEPTTVDFVKKVKSFEQDPHIDEEKQQAMQKVIAVKTSSHVESILASKSRNNQASQSRG